ncbi:MAG: hypothetical protein M3Q72_04140 [Actinomycetota bacterium]|nr:hypothetical protein [Actinomycetota bacterium]
MELTISRRGRCRGALVVMLTVALSVIAACAQPTEVAVERSRDLGDVPRPTETTTETSTDPSTDPTNATTPPTGTRTDPTTPGSDPTVPPSTAPGADVFEEGPDKPEREYDDMVEATVADLENAWATFYPEFYGGEPYEPLEGGVWPVYPDRSDRVPGCGTSETSYRDILAFAAFYCPFGDFIAYDDGDEGIFGQLIEDLGPSIVPVVIAHEWGHVIQARNGTFDSGQPTIATEQQADCFSGAWTARARAGDVPGIEFTDTEVQAGMAALIAVRDPIDTSSSTPGAHGSGFDRVGAFQAGYLNGTGRCTELIDSPLPLVPNEFSEQNADPADRNPDAPFEDSSPDSKDGIFTIVAADLNTYWPLVFESTETPFPVLTVEAAPDPANVGCADLESVEQSAGHCQADGTVYYDESFMRELYDQFGDFGVGYVLGTAWSDAAQDLLESPFSDEPRSLLNDCLTGSWVRTILPDENDETSPTATARIEPGDLDEAVQTTLLIGDATADEDVAGTAFEKIDNFRDGALNGLEACSERIPD